MMWMRVHGCNGVSEGVMGWTEVSHAATKRPHACLMLHSLRSKRLKLEYSKDSEWMIGEGVWLVALHGGITVVPLRPGPM